MAGGDELTDRTMVAGGCVVATGRGLVAEIAEELGTNKRTVQRYLKAASGEVVAN